MMKQKRRKKISNEELIQYYSYYYPTLSMKLLRQQIIGLKKQTEKYIYHIRTPRNKKKSINDLVFIDFVEGYEYPFLQKKYKLSGKGIAKAIHTIRKSLLDGIKKDIEVRALVNDHMNEKEIQTNNKILCQSRVLESRVQQ